jgi:hypothetical protein
MRKTTILAVLAAAALALPAAAAAAEAPAVDSESASVQSPFAATLEAQVNPNEEPTTKCTFEWGPTAAYGSEAPCEPEVLEGFGDQLVVRHLEGLDPNTTYHFRVLAANATGTTEGADSELTTKALEAPLVDAESVSGVTTDSAKLEGQVNPNWQEATYAFEYATNEAMTGATTVSPPEGTEPFPAGFEDHAAAVAVEALTPGTTYYYRLAATNASGTTHGPVQSFTTVGPPLIEETGAASAITRTGAHVKGGKLDPVGAAVTWYYRYIDQAGYEKGLEEDPEDPYAKGGTSLPLGHLPASYEAQPTSGAQLEGLAPGTTYHFALVARSEAGEGIGPDASFTTAPPSPPHATTGAASAVTQTTANVAATLETGGLDTSWQLELSSSPGVWSTVASGSVRGEEPSATLGFALTGLAPGTAYSYRLLATNADGSADGGEAHFTTPAFPPFAGLPQEPGAVPFTPIATLRAQEPAETPGSGPPQHANARKLAKALKNCRRHKRGKPRKACKRAAHRRYSRH